ncbi:MAG TPA: tetratricopeptide repeat protein [Terriglobales bacterium]
MGQASRILAMTLVGAAACLPAQTRPAPSRPSTPSAQSRPADPLEEAESLLKKQQYAEAEEKLQTLIRTQARNPQAWFDLGFAQSHQGKTSEAVASYQSAVELAPDWFEANLNLGVDLAQSGKRSAAIPILRHAVELKPSTGGQQAIAPAWLTLAQTLEAEGSDPRGAAAAYDKATDLGLSPDSLTVVRAGSLLEKAGDLAAAEQHYRKAAESGDAAGMAKLIDLLRTEKRYSDAETWLRKYAVQNPQDPQAALQLARLLVAEGKKEEAAALLKPLAGPTASASANQELGELYLDNHQYAEAAPLFEQALGTKPRDAELHYDLGLALLHQLKYAEAEAELVKAVQTRPDLGDAYGLLAEAAFQNKHYELCLRALDVRARSLTETPATYFLRATAYDSLHMYKPAVANYKQFLAVAAGKFPDQEFQARHRIKAIEPQ